MTSLDGISASLIQKSLSGVCDSKGCMKFSSLRTQPFPLAPRRQGRFARSNVGDSATEIP